MASSHQTLETPAEHKLPETEENYNTTGERVQRAQWLRAAILGASDGLLSTTSLMLGVSAVKEDRWSMILSGVAGAIAGGCSMAVGEFVSVATQREIEKTTVRKSSLDTELGKKDINGKVKLDISENSNSTISVELTPSRTIPCGKPTCDQQPEKATKISAVEMTENGEGEESFPSPHKAASASALAFLCGSLVPLISAIFSAQSTVRMVVVVEVTSIALALFGGMGARFGGASAMPSAVGVLVGGWIAMTITYGLFWRRISHAFCSWGFSWGVDCHDNHLRLAQAF